MSDSDFHRHRVGGYACALIDLTKGVRAFLADERVDCPDNLLALCDDILHDVTKLEALLADHFEPGPKLKEDDA